MLARVIAHRADAPDRARQRAEGRADLDLEIDAHPSPDRLAVDAVGNMDAGDVGHPVRVVAEDGQAHRAQPRGHRATRRRMPGEADGSPSPSATRAHSRAP